MNSLIYLLLIKVTIDLMNLRMKNGPGDKLLQKINLDYGYVIE